MGPLITSTFNAFAHTKALFSKRLEKSNRIFKALLMTRTSKSIEKEFSPLQLLEVIGI